MHPIVADAIKGAVGALLIDFMAYREALAAWDPGTGPEPPFRAKLMLVRVIVGVLTAVGAGAGIAAMGVSQS